ncbi:acyl carrier protein [Paraburkholderia aromaticivorans]|uniref:Acyl carrier protein n=1 Tax=Paraburkholderia aromaticivorans TaxID=2026199 RepID=A0A248VLD0_9BURK|nr:acyl carrier protein [Paraburkholderia aromaticivorans]ASV99209.1 acyl carrier protein [Paraburkholderia aromaticivorans]
MKTHVRRMLHGTACLAVPVDTLGDGDDLYAAGLSSLGAVRVMMAIEDECGIEIPGALITHEMFESIDSLASVIALIVREESIATRI